MKDKILLALVTFALKALAILPYRALYILSDLIYPILYYVVKYRRKTVHTNIASSFPEKSTNEIIEIEKGFYRHFCDYVMETLKLLHISDEEMRRRMRFTNSELIEEIRTDGRPIFIYLGHQCNWEYITSITMWIDSSISVCHVYHPLSNKVMDKVIYSLRSRFNSTGIPQKQTLRAVLGMIKEGRQPLLGLIADQRPQRHPEPEWTTFLNQETPIITGGETMGRKLNAHFIYGSVRCVRRGYYEITLQQIEPVEGEEHTFSKQFMRMLEKDIIEQPHMWLWSHKRWSIRKDYYTQRQS